MGILRLAVRVTAVFFVLLALPAPHAMAWNDTGHRLVALIAYERLDSKSRAEILDLLRQHPRFEEDFLGRMPRRIREADEAAQNEWLFTQAAVWPDLTAELRGRLKRRYDREPWHTIGDPVFLSRADARSLAGSIPGNLDRTWDPSVESDRNLNVVQALHRNRAVLQSPDVSREDKAVAMCWLLHLTGDVHQPLHTASLFSREELPEGDGGGTRLLVRERSHLHDVWDQGVGTTRSLAALTRKMETYLGQKRLRKLGNRSMRKMDFSGWTDESLDAAWSFAYDEEIIDEVAGADVGRDGGIRLSGLSSDYRELVRDVSVQRVVQAAFRLEKLLRKQASPTPRDRSQTDDPQGRMR